RLPGLRSGLSSVDDLAVSHRRTPADEHEIPGPNDSAVAHNGLERATRSMPPHVVHLGILLGGRRRGDQHSGIAARMPRACQTSVREPRLSTVTWTCRPSATVSPRSSPGRSCSLDRAAATVPTWTKIGANIRLRDIHPTITLIRVFERNHSMT